MVCFKSEKHIYRTDKREVLFKYTKKSNLKVAYLEYKYRTIKVGYAFKIAQLLYNTLTLCTYKYIVSSETEA